ncbi:MAG TPA: hypothetical protein VGL39_19935 [Jatrophihabitantaceae bacterium]
MITCVVDYTIDASKVDAFETFARTWIGLFGVDPEFVAADRFRDESGCVIRYERSFMRPVQSE